ncbi:MAG: hypothetical protein ACRDCT_11310, partial [Shewanella sp.]
FFYKVLVSRANLCYKKSGLACIQALCSLSGRRQRADHVFSHVDEDFSGTKNNGKLIFGYVVANIFSHLLNFFSDF